MALWILHHCSAIIHSWLICVLLNWHSTSLLSQRVRNVFYEFEKTLIETIHWLVVLIEHVQCTEMFYFWDLQILIRKEKDTRKVQTQKTKNSIKSIKSKEKPHMYAFKLINNKIEIVWRVSKGVIKDLIKCYCLICLPKWIKVAIMHLGEFCLLLISTSTNLLQIKRYVSVNSGLVQGIFTNKKICECG